MADLGELSASFNEMPRVVDGKRRVGQMLGLRLCHRR